MISFFRLILIFIFFLVCQPVFADAIAHVILTKGAVTAQNNEGVSRMLKRRSEIFIGDTIITQKKSSVQLRFIDKALLTIKAESKFNIEAYQLANIDQLKQNKAIMNLLKGGFRTITGNIGKGNKKAYRVNTPAASIGIRGTNYEVQQETLDTFVMAIYSGGIYVQNTAGSINLGFDSDFNFTRVRQGRAPQGLLMPPESLTQHTTTPHVDEEHNTQDNDQTEDESHHNEADSLANSNSNSEPQSETDLTDLAQQPNLADNPTTTEPTNTDLPPLQAPLDDAPDSAPDLVPEPIIEIASFEPDPVIDPLDSFPEPIIPDPVIPDDSSIPTPPPPDEPEPPRSIPLFDFSDPYSHSTPAPSPMQEVINDAEYGLMESGQLATMAIPLFNSSTLQNQSSLSTSSTLSHSSVSNFQGYDYSNDPTSINIHYQTIDPQTGATTNHEQEVTIDINVVSLKQLRQHISQKLDHKHVEINGIRLGQTDLLSDFRDDLRTYLKARLKGSKKDSIQELVAKIKNLVAQIKELIAQMKSPDTPADDWLAGTGSDLQIGNGAWDTDSDNPLIGIESNLDEETNRLEILYKPVTPDATVNNLVEFFDCASSNKVCDIQVNLVALADNIRWGAWLAEPTDQIQVYQHDTDSSGNATGQFNNQDNMLLFWLAAERANVNQLSGSASFSGSANCTDFSQCIGIADDGMVQSINGQFDVNFNNGSITNGQLTVNTAAANNSIYSSGPLSTWQVNFSGQMAAGQPEFVSNNLSGTVSQGGQQVSSDVTGTLGGIFVKPGDVFAGGYNLGTADNTDKHTAGVFALEQQP